MSQEPCLFYRVKNVYFPCMNMGADRDSIRVKIVRHEWCAHSKSRHNHQQISEPSVPCDGDPQKCVIPD